MALRPEVFQGWPPGGWQFYQAETDWHAPDPLQNTFEQQVNNIIKMRAANPRFNLPNEYMAVAMELADYTEKRIESHPKYCVAVPEVVKKTISHVPGWPRAGVDAAEARVDPAALIEWIGEGGQPVSPVLAEQRAETCAGCPENSDSPTCRPDRRLAWYEWMTEPIAASLGIYLGLKNKMKLATQQDKVLGKCLACRCELKLKVWTPLRHILANADEAGLGRLDLRCWVLHEKS